MGLHQINTSEYYFKPFFNQSGIIFQVSEVSIMGPISSIEWGDFSDTGFFADVTTERDCETV